MTTTIHTDPIISWDDYDRQVRDVLAEVEACK